MVRRESMLTGLLAVALMAFGPMWTVQASAGSGKGQKAADETTDLTGGQAGVPDEYADTPVRQGKLIAAEDNKWLNKEVQNSQGKTVGKVKQLLKDKKTGDIEYAVISFNEADRVMPMRWSQFNERNDRLQLNMKDEELTQAINKFSPEDMSPDVSMHMKDIKDVRKDFKGERGPKSSTATGEPAAAGPMGESSASGGGASATQGLPPGGAPGFEGGNPSSKR